MDNLERALLVAEKVHSNQSYDIYPYMYHIKEVVRIAIDLGYGEDIILACALHDALEDSDLSYNDIKKAFGEEVAEIVYCVTDELGRNRKERKRKTYPKIKGNWKATVVKLCDRIANIQHSKNYNQKMFDMYKRESSDLFDNISDSNHDPSVQKAWDEMNILLAKETV